MNAEALKARIRNLANKKEIDPQALMQLFFMDQFLLRLSKYEDKDHIIVKGGMLIVTLLGISTRSTMDIDTAVKSYNLSKKTAMEIFTGIAKLPHDDGCEFIFKKIEHIMDDNDYQGYRIYFTGKKEKIIQSLHLDLSTGDQITPREVELTYKTFLNGEKVNIKTYNIETVIAEKLETIFTRGTANTRMKDFYDLYIINKMLRNNLDYPVLKMAFKNTLKNRKSEFIIDIINEVIDDIKSDDRMLNRWVEYSKSYSFTKNISFDDCVIAAIELTDIAIK
jgi:predicted nucleotidyltransferase component of viral defense system